MLIDESLLLIIVAQFGLSLRSCLLAWNKTTQSWLRFVAYDRTPKYKLLFTYLLSALWHGKIKKNVQFEILKYFLQNNIQMKCIEHQLTVSI